MVEIRSHNHASELISLSGTYLEQHESENNLPMVLFIGSPRVPTTTDQVAAPTEHSWKMRKS